ncbi:MAG: alkaline phosphatase [Burkholderiales bacterium]|nr:alkaline phosphatase [Burkholderiales bacterium]MDE2433903.1 alkaline phosphatase [Burkholderiales bacterium]
MAGAADAAPVISRLTPPSNPITATATTLARFLPGQRFDLQATVQTDGTNKIAKVEFAVDGTQVATLTNDLTSTDQFSGKTSLVKNGLVAGLAPNSVVASLRAYSNTHAGVHTLTVTATDEAGGVSTRTGNFEVVSLVTNGGRPAKNVIIMLGDGMGAAHRTAARVMAKGYLQGKAQDRLAMDTFPNTAMVMTASLNSIVTDSAPGMANYVTGNKANNNQEGVFPDDTTAKFDNPRVEYLSEFLHRTKGTSTGIVTTADIFDATPAANAVHTQDRGAGSGIIDQYLDDRNATGLSVLMGGGRKWFLPATTSGSARSSSSDYVLNSDITTGWGVSAGAIDTNRDVIADFQSAGFTYAPDKTTLDSAGTPDKLLGLFALGNMNVAFDKLNGRRGASSVTADYGFPDQPMLPEMTDKALQVLSKNRNGFFLMVEGASIDKQAHLMDSDRWIVETIEFDKAIEKAKEFAESHPDTIVIVTADHECAGAAIIGASVKTAQQLKDLASGATSGTPDANTVVGTYDAAKFPAYTVAADGYPLTTDIDYKMLIGYGANADRYETWLSSAYPVADSSHPFYKSAPVSTNSPSTVFNRNNRAASYSTNTYTNSYLITGQVPGGGGNQAAHTGSDIPLSAFGRGSSQFAGVIDNTDVFFKLAQIAVGGSK